jgi:hypothetical protein
LRDIGLTVVFASALFYPLAYVGVPASHFLADMENLQFPCHWVITFRALGGDGLRPAGFFWFGWDYGHSGDRITLPPELMAQLPPALSSFSKGKVWSLEEIEHDLIDVAIGLQEACVRAKMGLDAVIDQLKV